MKHHYRRYVFSLLGAACAGAFFGYGLYGNFTVTSLVNGTFLLSLFLFSAGLLLFLTEKGFFNGIVFSFKRFYRMTTKKGELLRQVTPEEERESYLPREKDFLWTGPLLLAGGALFFFSLVAAFLL